MNRNYPAFVLRDGDDYTITFPDLPGCLTFGATVEEAFDNACEALEGHLAAMVEDGMRLPDPTPLADVRPDDEDADAVVTRVLVPAMMPGRTVRTNISVDEGLLLAIDAHAPNRSAFFAEAARNELSRRQRARRVE